MWRNVTVPKCSCTKNSSCRKFLMSKSPHVKTFQCWSVHLPECLQCQTENVPKCSRDETSVPKWLLPKSQVPKWWEADHMNRDSIKLIKSMIRHEPISLMLLLRAMSMYDRGCNLGTLEFRYCFLCGHRRPFNLHLDFSKKVVLKLTLAKMDDFWLRKFTL